MESTIIFTEWLDKNGFFDGYALWHKVDDKPLQQYWKEVESLLHDFNSAKNSDDNISVEIFRKELDKRTRKINGTISSTGQNKKGH